MKKIVIPESELFKLYIDEDKTAKQIADLFQVSISVITNHLAQYKIKKPKKQVLYTEAELRRVYLKENRTAKETAEYFGIAVSTLGGILGKYKIYKERADFVDRETFKRLYITENRTLAELAMLFGKSESTVRLLAKRYNLNKKRSYSFVKVSKEEIYQFYILEKHTQKETASHFGISFGQVCKLIRKYGLTSKALGTADKRVGQKAWNKGLDKSDPRIAAYAEKRTGKNNPLYGKNPWNKGKTKDTDKKVAEIAAVLKGKKISESTIEKMRNAKLGLRGEQTNNWRGGYREPYLRERDEFGIRKYSHRAVAEKLLNRQLNTDEQVHHLNHDRFNNDICNLVVLDSRTHTKLHRFCKSKEPIEQLQWLKANGFNYIYLAELGE